MQSNDPDRNRDISRQLRAFDRRIQRLEDTQVTGRELNQLFEQVYQEIDDLNIKVDRLETKIDQLQTEVHIMDQKISTMDQKIDIIMRHITGISGA